MLSVNLDGFVINSHYTVTVNKVPHNVLKVEKGCTTNTGINNRKVAGPRFNQGGV